MIVRVSLVLMLAAIALSLSAASTPERIVASRRCAAESAVLLKNDGTLPLGEGAAVQCAGDDFICCGKGSAWVHVEHMVSLKQGLVNGGFRIDDSASVAVWAVVRDSEEGREACLDDYELTAAERKALADFKAAGKKIVVVLNVGRWISLKELKEDPAVAAILYVSFPGMEGGNAVADVLSGKVNPSGRLNVTLAEKLSDYPSDATWQEAKQYVAYEEDIFLGYRYFSTVPGAAAKVVYPFGYGLSYTSFAHSDRELEVQPDGYAVTVKITNVGKVAGRESVLVYSGIEGGKAEHPARELRGFAKTKLLAPGESDTLKVMISRESLAYFDDEGVSGKIGSWAVDGGRYTFYAGGSPDEAVAVGSVEIGGVVLSTPGFKMTPFVLSRRLRANGVHDEFPVLNGEKTSAAERGNANPFPKTSPEHPITLQQVAKGEHTVDEFVDQMPTSDLVQILQGQDNILQVGNTRSIGVFKKYGMPGLQTADGPVGIRLGKHPKKGMRPTPEQCSTAFPATALSACSFDVALQEEYGRVLGEEAAAVGIDIHLAPGICLARHPMCGRNFEYMGEDPFLAGKMAAAFIRGVQSQGVASTIKHFAGNNRENTRRESQDIISERACRELYLKGFEIAVKEAHPKCLMTAYNGINGCYAGAHFGMIEGILRGEWGFDGLVMTDWNTRAHMWQNVAAGNDVKMPFNSSTTRKETVLEENISFDRCARQNRIDHRRIKASARRVVELVLASPRFKATLGK